MTGQIFPSQDRDRPRTLRVNGQERRYIVHLPPQTPAQKPLPVVIMFHGGGGTALGAMFETGWTEKADAEGFLVVFPEALPPDPEQPPRFLQNPQIWNNGSGRGHAGRTNVDDVGFIQAMLQDLHRQFPLDQQRIFATGFSNGASMCFRVGAELADQIVAIAPVAGHFWLSPVQLSAPVSLLYLVGTLDPLNPGQGGEVEFPWGGREWRPPYRASVDKWLQLLGCQALPADLAAAEATGLAYRCCQGGAAVEFYAIAGLGHIWPGGKALLRSDWVGPNCQHFRATDVIWDFFVRHPRQHS